MAETRAPASVLDASALLAFAQDEVGAAVVDAALEGRSAISVVNWAEALSKIAERGGDPAALEAEYRECGFIGGALSIEPLTEGDCVEVARLRPVTEPQGLSLADRACLVLAARLGVPALTSDGAFADADVEAEVTLIR
ncbi:MAG TPA: type II toxin-antitoxin system VapC family toxin [Solirubrobacterales bacterium]|nr:type II toxin-antitoxin system VapC family toxin [Solirubrobacterales bacterium]